MSHSRVCIGEGSRAVVNPRRILAGDMRGGGKCHVIMT